MNNKDIPRYIKSKPFPERNLLHRNLSIFFPLMKHKVSNCNNKEALSLE